MNTLISLTLFPLAIAFLALLPPYRLKIRKMVGAMANLALCAGPIYLLVTTLDSGSAYFQIESRLIEIGMPATEFLIALFIVHISLRAKRYLPVILVVAQWLILVSLHGTDRRHHRQRHLPLHHRLSPRVSRALPGGKRPAQILRFPDWPGCFWPRSG